MRNEDSVKNHVDTMIFYTAICFRAKANSFDGRYKFDICIASFATSRSEMRINMAISSISNIDLSHAMDSIDSSITKSISKEDKGSFDSIFESAVNMLKDTEELTNKAEEEEMKYALGYDNTLELMVAQNKANLSLSYVVAVRDKVLDAYSELMNMQF